jgi:integrase/recombinase XerD
VTTWGGRRDRTLLLFAIQSGLRAAEFIALRCEDITFGPSAHVRCRGKGRKERCMPLRPEAAGFYFREQEG